MRKSILLTLLFIMAAFLSACSMLSSQNETSSTQMTTQAIQLGANVTDLSTVDTALNYEDLKAELYQLLYDDLYDSLYEDLSLSNIAADELLYEEIYASVRNRFELMLAEDEIGLLFDTVQDQIYAIADLVEESVVGISTYLDLEGQSLGSGVVYKYVSSSDTYYVITNHHVVESGNNFKIVFCDSSKVIGTLIGYDEDVDLAVLSFSGSELERTIRVSPLGNSASEVPGAMVIAAGNPEGYDFYGSISMGVLSGVNRSVDSSIQRYLQHDASINSGNSGGPLYNLDGEVIGINVSKYASTDIEGMGFAIPIDTVKTVIAIIEAGN